MPHAERADRVAEFRALFCLDQRRPGPIHAVDFEEELKRDSDTLLGRVKELQRVKKVLAATQTGVLWIGGAGGCNRSIREFRGNVRRSWYKRT
jgi:hypothetical protein